MRLAALGNGSFRLAAVPDPRVDWEVELGVVIDSRARNVPGGPE
ncbi:MAG: hypothetical protein ACOYD4_00370 [Solirubrobacterales bacterium]